MARRTLQWYYEIGRPGIAVEAAVRPRPRVPRPHRPGQFVTVYPVHRSLKCPCSRRRWRCTQSSKSPPKTTSWRTTRHRPPSPSTTPTRCLTSLKSSCRRSRCSSNVSGRGAVHAAQCGHFTTVCFFAGTYSSVADIQAASRLVDAPFSLPAVQRYNDTLTRFYDEQSHMYFCESWVRAVPTPVCRGVYSVLAQPRFVPSVGGTAQVHAGGLTAPPHAAVRVRNDATARAARPARDAGKHQHVRGRVGVLRAGQLRHGPDAEDARRHRVHPGQVCFSFCASVSVSVSLPLCPSSLLPTPDWNRCPRTSSPTAAPSTSWPTFCCLTNGTGSRRRWTPSAATVTVPSSTRWVSLWQCLGSLFLTPRRLTVLEGWPRAGVGARSRRPL